MPNPWQFQHTATLSSIAHHTQRIKLGAFAVRLNYRNQYRSRSEELTCKPVPAETTEKTAVFTTKNGKVELTFRFNLQNEALKLTTEVKPLKACLIESIELLINHTMVGAHGHNLRIFKNGYQSWSETHSFGVDEREKRVVMRWFDVLQANARNRASGQRGEFTSETYTLVKNQDQNLTFLIGQQKPLKQYLSFRMKFIPDNITRNFFSMLLRWDFCGKVFAAQETLALDPVLFSCGEDENQLLDTYLAALQPGGLKERELPSGWCSWYYYFANVTADNIHENVDAAVKEKVDWQFFVLDDGYQRSLGDWLIVNEKFPGGLKPLADHINRAGMRPGIWTAPFVTMKDSRLAADHPEWLLKQPFSDKPVICGFNPNWGHGFAFYALDVTHPGMQAYLKEVYTTLVHTFGFEFLKLDFVYAASLPGQPYDASFSGAERLQLGYRLIREAAGRDTFILGCGSPLTPAIGLVDAMRIGPDVAPYWSDWKRERMLNDANALSTKVAVRSILNRCQMHRQWWINDPDCLMLRDTETSLSEAERFTLINAAVITGGMGVFSDDLTKLKKDTFLTIEKIKELSLLCDTGRPYALDFMEKPMPELVFNTAGYLAVFNFSERERTKTLSLTGKLKEILPQGTKLIDVWQQTAITVQGEAISLGKLNKHGSRLFKINH